MSAPVDVNGETPDDEWSAIATGWAELWGGVADPVRRVAIETAGIGAGTRVLDVGCGSGELLRLLEEAGALAAGIDPASKMVELARGAAPASVVEVGSAEDLPWADDSFDVVTAVNALQFADDTFDAIDEFVRVARPGGRIVIATWAERSRNDLTAVDAALAAARGETLPPDGDLRRTGVLAEVLRDEGFTVDTSRVVEFVWEIADDDALVRAALLGESADAVAAAAPVVLAAARPLRTPDGRYRLCCAFHLVVARAR